jgi:hypothetical protein
MRLFAFIFIVTLIQSCKNGLNDGGSEVKYAAKAGDVKLDVEDLKAHLLMGDVIKDSNYYKNKTIERWATEALFYQEAIKKLNEDEIQVEKKVEAYRRELINYIYQTKIIEANLDTSVSKEEIEQYYNEHLDNFILKENIVKVNYLKVPVKAPGLIKIKRLLFSTNPNDTKPLLELCVQNAENFFMNDSTWLFLDDIKKEIPALKDQPDLSLSQGRMIQFSDDLYYYYLKIKDVKVKNGLSPLNFEKQNIKKFIINNRKTQLIVDYKQQLLEKAKSDKTFEIYK